MFGSVVGGVLVGNVFAVWGIDVVVSRVAGGVAGDFGGVVGGETVSVDVRVVPFHKHFRNLFRVVNSGRDVDYGDFCLSVDELVVGDEFVLGGVSWRVIGCVFDVYGFWVNELVRV